jgi:hypothetical protein
MFQPIPRSFDVNHSKEENMEKHSKNTDSPWDQRQKD